MSRLTPDMLARAAAAKAFDHVQDPKRADALAARGLDEGQLTRTMLAIWNDPKTEWQQQSRGGIQWLSRQHNLAGAINLKDPGLSTVFPCSPAKLDRWARQIVQRESHELSTAVPSLKRGPVPVTRAIREREFRDALAEMTPRKFSDLVRSGPEPDRDEWHRDERSR